MYRSQRVIESLYFGFDLTNFYLRVDFTHGFKLAGNAILKVHFLRPIARLVTISPQDSAICQVTLCDVLESGSLGQQRESGEASFREILEARIPFADLGWQPGQQAGFFLEIQVGETDLERHPDGTAISFRVPNNEFEQASWHV